MPIEVNIDYENESFNTFIEDVLKKTLRFLKEDNLSVSVLLTDDTEMQEINKKYRGIDKSTDVLSFAMREGEAFPLGDLENLGDIVISIPYAEKQAKEYNVSFKQELKRLLVHGCLHLLGYDHENVSEVEAEEMFKKQEEILDLLA